ncbi:MAG: SMI1/KNR4 family protein [Fimbriimonadales bacterium]
MRWTSQGPKLSERDITVFERRSRQKVPAEIRWFLANKINGGHPKGGLEFSLVGFRGNSGFCLHGINGINHPSPNYDVLYEVQHKAPWCIRWVWPVGYDVYNGAVVFVREGQHKGQIRFIPFEEGHRGPLMRSYFVDPDIATFARMLQLPARDRRSQGQ